MPKDQKEVLADRVRRKLILSENQLVPAAIRYEMTEARGLDYIGKIHLCQHVIEHGKSFLELSTGDGKSILVKPEQLKKSCTDTLLIGVEIPDGKTVQIALRRVRLVRKVRMSLMG